MKNDQLDKILRYIQKVDKKVDVIESSMASKDDVDTILNNLDGYASKIDSYAQEMAAMQHKIDRLERYINILADKVGVDLDGIKTSA